MRLGLIEYLLRSVDRHNAAKIIEMRYPGYSIKKIRADAGVKKGKKNVSRANT